MAVLRRKRGRILRKTVRIGGETYIFQNTTPARLKKVVRVLRDLAARKAARRAK